MERCSTDLRLEVAGQRSFSTRTKQVSMDMADIERIIAAGDSEQVHAHGLQLLDEAMLFLQRHLPVAGRSKPASSSG